MEWMAALNTQLLLDWKKKKIESKCNMKFGDCQTMFESDLTVSQMPNFHYLTIEIHILKSLSIRTGRKSKISVSRTWLGRGGGGRLNLVLCYIPEKTCVDEESWAGGLLSFWPPNQGARSIEVGAAATKAGLSCTAVSKHRAVCGKRGGQWVVYSLINPKFSSSQFNLCKQSALST